MPELIVIAGANGSGKSSLTKLSASDLPLIDPDAIARELAPENPESAALAAGRKAIARTRDYVNANCSFMVETTLAGNNYLNLMGEVKALGWIVTLIYVGIDNPSTNIQRVRSRVKLGGHDVPRVDILRRYERSLVNLNKAAKIADKLILYDNSTSIGYQIVATIEGDTTVIYMPEIPVWLARSNLKLET
ncbi:MAG: zeta toxin family protein [Microcystaceae cyanobacterium]